MITKKESLSPLRPLKLPLRPLKMREHWPIALNLVLSDRRYMDIYMELCQTHSRRSPIGRACYRVKDAFSELKSRLDDEWCRVSPEDSGFPYYVGYGDVPGVYLHRTLEEKELGVMRAGLSRFELDQHYPADHPIARSYAKLMTALADLERQIALSRF